MEIRVESCWESNNKLVNKHGLTSFILLQCCLWVVLGIYSQHTNKGIETLIFSGKLNHGIMNYKGDLGIHVLPINILDRKGRSSHCHEQYFKVDFNLN